MLEHNVAAHSAEVALLASVLGSRPLVFIHVGGIAACWQLCALPDIFFDDDGDLRSEQLCAGAKVQAQSCHRSRSARERKACSGPLNCLVPRGSPARGWVLYGTWSEEVAQHGDMYHRVDTCTPDQVVVCVCDGGTVFSCLQDNSTAWLSVLEQHGSGIPSTQCDDESLRGSRWGGRVVGWIPDPRGGNPASAPQPRGPPSPPRKPKGTYCCTPILPRLLESFNTELAPNPSPRPIALDLGTPV